MPLAPIARDTNLTPTTPRTATRARPIAMAEHRLAAVPLTDAQIAQVHGGSVEGDAALRAFLDRWFAATADGPRWPVAPDPTFDGVL